MSLEDDRREPGLDEIAPPVTTCVDCGGRAHRLGFWTEEDLPQPGDVVSYRCQDCRDRWDLVVPEDEEEYG